MNKLPRYILKRQANQQYQERGYHVFRRAFRPDQINTIADLATRLITPYSGEILRQDGKLAANEFFPGTQLIKNSAFNATLPISEPLDPLSAALRTLITSPALAEHGPPRRTRSSAERCPPKAEVMSSNLAGSANQVFEIAAHCRRRLSRSAQVRAERRSNAQARWARR